MIDLYLIDILALGYREACIGEKLSEAADMVSV